MEFILLELETLTVKIEDENKEFIEISLVDLKKYILKGNLHKPQTSLDENGELIEVYWKLT